MTRDRPYRAAMPDEVARAEIEFYAGAQFDRQVATAFLEEVGRQEAAPA
jgi:HD-GYP domain-containing protein (c-di-GMP phosphodiesterase class II)